MALSTDQVEHYRKEGYVFPIPVMTREEALAYRTACARGPQPCPAENSNAWQLPARWSQTLI